MSRKKSPARLGKKMMTIGNNSLNPTPHSVSHVTEPRHTRGVESRGSNSSVGEWAQVVQRLDRLSGSSPSPVDISTQLPELFRLQMEIGHHQLKVELLSKVAESAMVTVRKLHQPQ